MSIRIHYDEINYRLKRSGKIKKFLEKVILAENKVPGDLNFVFTNDEKLLGININFLGHDYYTDVISFVDSSDVLVGGEVYISIDTVNRNALTYGVSRYEEVLRVMIHGTLHLCGYKDGTEGERDMMTERQEMNLKEFRRVD
ncbi:MAG: rRNA maturation RNase YbeY [Bacteroidales bacterium]